MLFFPIFAHSYTINGANVEWINDHKGTAGLDFTLEEGWHIFWAHPGAVGIPTAVTISQQDQTEVLVNLWPAPISFMIGPLEGWGYENKVIIPMAMPSWVNPNLPYHLQISGQICKDVCVPFLIEDEIEPLALATQQQLDLLHQTVNQLPILASSDVTAFAIFEPSTENDDLALLQVNVTNPLGFNQPKLFESAQQNLGYITKNTQLSADKTQAEFTLEVSGLKFDANALLERDLQLTIVDSKQSYYLNAAVNKGRIALKNTPPLSLIILLQALLVGLIFNIMPCVLPVLGIKLGTIVGLAGAEKKEVRLRFLLTALGILLAFSALALMFVIAKQLGVYLGWGAHFQQPLFIVFMMIIVTIFAASLLGLWTLNQISVTSKSTQTSMLGEVGSGILATILATPCTVPFMAPVAAFAFASSSLNLFFIFIFIGLGMALPWLMVAVFPQAVSLLPKPGRWMLYVKRFFGLLLIATLLWLLWVLHNQIIFWLWLLICLCVVAIFAVFIISNYLAFTKKWWVIAGISVAMMLLAAFAIPPKNTGQINEAQKGELVGEKFTQATLQDILQNGQHVLVIGTADWCITCKVNEKRVLSQPEIAQKLKEHNVAILIADMTSDNPDGQIWMQQLERYGLPLTVYYRSLTDFEILPTFLSEADILNQL